MKELNKQVHVIVMNKKLPMIVSFKTKIHLKHNP